MQPVPSDAATASTPLTASASQEFVGRWYELISTTNWDKGRIISEWRGALIETEAPSSAYSDEAWSNLVGNVTPQHVGRLRRVYQRFAADRVSYHGLCWSHFCAALEWDDAEMWLEGALQNNWSVSKMRRQRWETLGSLPGDEPSEEDVVATEPAEEHLLTPADLEEEVDLPPELMFDQTPVPVEGTALDPDPHPVTHPFPAAAEAPQTAGAAPGSAKIYAEQQDSLGQFVHPFDQLKELPEDVADAFERFREVVLRHRSADWQEVSQADLLTCLESLKSLVVSA